MKFNFLQELYGLIPTTIFLVGLVAFLNHATALLERILKYRDNWRAKHQEAKDNKEIAKVTLLLGGVVRDGEPSISADDEGKLRVVQDRARRVLSGRELGITDAQIEEVKKSNNILGGPYNG